VSFWNKTGANAVFQNMFEEKVILEVVTGTSFKGLFKKSRIKEALKTKENEKHWPEVLGLIVIGDRIDHVKDHGLEEGLSDGFFEPPEQRFFP